MAYRSLTGKLDEIKQNRVPLPVPWRNVEEDFFSTKKKLELKKFINDMKLPEKCKNINLFMTGSIGSGKSSFANTLKTVFRDNGSIANTATVYGPNMSSVTRKLHEITLKTFENGNKIRIYDCRGIDPFDRDTTFENDLLKVIYGHVMKDYEFKNGQTIDPEYRTYREFPSISDQMHCVLFVMKATDVHRNKVPPTLQTLKSNLAVKNVPIRLILTSVDLLDLCEYGALRSIFSSKDVQSKVDSAKMKFDLQDNQVLPIANYVCGTDQEIYRDVLALQAVKNILEEALSFIENNA